MEDKLLIVDEQWLLDAPEWILNLTTEQNLENASGFMANFYTGFNEFCFDFYKSFIYDDRFLIYLDGLKNTLILTFFALLLGVTIGIVVALVRVSWDKNGSEMSGFPRFLLGFANFISKVYLTVIRGTPVVVQILLMYFVFMASSRNKVLVGVLTFGINSGAYVAEIIRGGIMSVDAGQTEAGRSLGFSYIPTMRYIVLPQAFKASLPALGNEFIVLLKETAVAGYIGLADLTFSANKIGGVTYDYMFPLMGVAVIYLIFVSGLTYLIGRLERRFKERER